MSMFPVQLSEQISLSQLEAADASARAVDGRIHNYPVQGITTFDHKSRRKNAKSLEVFSRAGKSHFMQAALSAPCN